MIRRWLLRLSLVVGAFFVGLYVTFLLLILVTWDQSVIDLVSTSVAATLAVVIFLKTGHVTRRQDVSTETAPTGTH